MAITTDQQAATHLQMFYDAYREWLDKGAPNGMPFYRSDGLCHSVTLWCRARELNPGAVNMKMSKQFYVAGLDRIYPFDTPTEFKIATHTDRCHVNPRRVAWVDKHASRKSR